jgi:hypothetical protein
VLVELGRSYVRQERVVVGERRQRDREVVPARPVRGLPSGPRLAVEVARLAADRVRNAEPDEQVALVARVDVHRGLGELGDDVDAVEHAGEDPLGDVRLRKVGRCVVEAAGEAAEDARIADVRPREPAGDHAADVRCRLDERDVRSRLLRGNCGGDAGAGGAEDGDVRHATNG